MEFTAALTAITCCRLCIMLPFIILSFVFANGNSECLTEEITEFNVSLDLQTWLRVQASMRLVLALALVPAIIGSCCADGAGAVLGYCGLLFQVLFGFFNVAWLIVGAIMFWGDLYQAGTCDSDLTIYMFANLILGFVTYV